MVDYICILDFEATCWPKKSLRSNMHEIIEFPSVLLKWDDEKKIRKVSEIQQYVKPLKYPVVSEFCKNLTGITQEIVNAGIPLETAIKNHCSWLTEFSNHNTMTIVTCGDWDLKTMLPLDLINLGRKSPTIYLRWVNIKHLYEIVKKVNRVKGMEYMLAMLDLPLEGRHHSGLDDSRNIANIFIKLVELGLTKKIFIEHIQYLRKVPVIEHTITTTTALVDDSSVTSI